MSTVPTPSQPNRRRFGGRTAVIAAGAIGFTLGAAGLVAAQHGADDPVAASSTAVTVDDSSSSSTPGSVDDSSTSTPVSVDDSSTSTPGSVDDSSSSSTPGSVDDSSSSTEVTVDDDDDTSSSMPSSSAPSSSAPAASLPAPFTKTYESAGGSITVTWNGSSFSLDAATPAAGFAAEVKDLRWDRVKVEFEGDDADARIEVRLSDDDHTIRVRID